MTLSSQLHDDTPNRQKNAFDSQALSGQKYPWESPQADLAEARRLIKKHGYRRRIPELEDAEAALPS